MALLFLGLLLHVLLIGVYPLVRARLRGTSGARALATGEGPPAAE